MATLLGQVSRSVRGLLGLARVTSASIGPAELNGSAQPTIELTHYWGSEALRIATNVATTVAGDESTFTQILQPAVGKTWLVVNAAVVCDLALTETLQSVRLRIGGVPRSVQNFSAVGAQAGTVAYAREDWNNVFAVPISACVAINYPNPLVLVGGSGIGFTAGAEGFGAGGGAGSVGGTTVQTRLLVYEVDT